MPAASRLFVTRRINRRPHLHAESPFSGLALGLGAVFFM